MQRYPRVLTGSENSKLRPSGNSASKKQTQRLLTNSGASPSLESSYDNDALDKTSIFWCPELVSRICITDLLPGEIKSILHFSDPDAPLSTDSTISVASVYQRNKNNLNASSREHVIEHPLVNVFGPDVTGWLFEAFPNLRKENRGEYHNAMNPSPNTPEFARFRDAVKDILQVSKVEIDQRIEEHRESGKRLSKGASLDPAVSAQLRSSGAKKV